MSDSTPRLRDKDAALGQSCGDIRQSLIGGLDWIADNEKLVGASRPALERELKRLAVEARRLERAATRPMSAAVFGPSQAGKSFLVGKFIQPEGREAKVVFNSGEAAEELDFLGEVNPQGGKETTGLVTRFSLQQHETPPGFPVVLRMLREVDVIKILANSFVFDLSSTMEDEALLRDEEINARFRALAETQARQGSAGGDCLSIEDVFELRKYFEDSLERHPYMAQTHLREAFWSQAEKILPTLPGDSRLGALSMLWGGIPEFDAFYRELKGGLDQMGHPDIAYASLDAIRDTSNGVLHVNRIYELAGQGGAGAAMDTLTVDDGRTVTLRRSLITALTSELSVTLNAAPWDFLRHTDLLDFPGARAREDTTPQKYLRREHNTNENPPREYCFLRGKVAVLFDNYVADLDLNTMLLCIPDGNLEVTKLPDLVEGWVKGTHGASPAERKDRPTSLLFVMTKMDRMFKLSQGATPEQAVENRFEVNLRPFSGWREEWHPGAPFDNVFLMRNPKAEEQEDLFTYADEQVPSGQMRQETGLNPRFETGNLPAFRSAFLNNGRWVAKYVGDAEDRWNALMRLNDGGATYLAEKLGPVCDPDLKYAQILPRAQKLAQAARSALDPYFDQDDVATRVKRRQERAKAIAGSIVRSPTAYIIGLFISEFYVSDEALEQAYLDYARARPAGNGDATRGDMDLSHVLEELGLHGNEGDDRADESAPARGPGSFGAAAVEKWLDVLHARAGDEELVRAYHLTPEQFLGVVEELSAGARRLDLIGRINLYSGPLIAYHQELQRTARVVAIGAGLVINDFVNTLGRSIVAESEDEAQAEKARGYFRRATPPGESALPVLPASIEDANRSRTHYLTDWLKVLVEIATENASSKSGQLVDAEQNERLGGLLAKIQPIGDV